MERCSVGTRTTTRSNYSPARQHPSYREVSLLSLPYDVIPGIGVKSVKAMYSGRLSQGTMKLAMLMLSPYALDNVNIEGKRW